MEQLYRKWILILGTFIFFAGVGFTANSFVLESESLKLIVYPKNGHFSLYRIRRAENGNRYLPLFDARNNSKSSRFSVLANKNMYHLESRFGGRRVQCEMDDNKIFVSFNISADFVVRQTFYFIDQTFKKDGAALKIDTAIENISGIPLAAGLFAVIDTNLGEPVGRPFFKNNFKQIMTATKFDPTNPEDALLISSNNKVASIFYINSESGTLPSYVQALSWEKAFFKYRTPSFSPGQSFSSAKRPNDSALFFSWPIRVIDAGYRSSISMIIGSSDSSAEDFPHFSTTAKIRDEGDKSKAPTAITASLIGVNDDVGNFNGRRPSNKKMTTDELRLSVARLIRDLERALESPDNYSDFELNTLYQNARDRIKHLED